MGLRDGGRRGSCGLRDDRYESFEPNARIHFPRTHEHGLGVRLCGMGSKSNLSEFGSAAAEHLGEVDDKQKSQLYVVTLFVQSRWPNLDFALSTQLESLRSAYTRSEVTPSKFQRSVSALLVQMGWSHTEEYVTDEGFSLDLAEPKSKRAIEVDGPSHFLQDVSTGEYVANGPTRFKSRLLRSSDWEVAHVSFFEWGDRSDQERRELLKAKLAQLGICTGGALVVEPGRHHSRQGRI
mmetsp:Transcript_18187/g.58707  ORF Transcript_18187/g.58707 Transcript_18187/m.58707 type:complete len:237 (-) Transcript_18187:385-1095(-)